MADTQQQIYAKLIAKGLKPNAAKAFAAQAAKRKYGKAGAAAVAKTSGK